MELARINVESWINPEVRQQITCWHGLSQTYLPDSLWRVSRMFFEYFWGFKRMKEASVSRAVIQVFTCIYQA